MSLAANLVQYLALLSRSLPAEALYPLALGAGRFLSGIQKNRLGAAEFNLEKLGVEDNRRELAVRTLRNWALCVSDQIRSLWLGKKGLQSFMEFEGSDNLEKTLVRGKGVILASAHLGNYELGGSFLASLGFPVYAVVEDIPRRHTGAMNRVRTRFGMGVVAYDDVPGMLGILRTGGILVLVTDRDFGFNGLEMEFGKGVRRIPLGPALLAERTGASIQLAYCIIVDESSSGICGKKVRCGRRRTAYKLIIEPPLEVNTAGSLRARVASLTAVISARLACVILSHPDQWFIFQDTWSKT